MPIYNGEKYACDSCVRGHRVSTCQHADRELKLIPPKGRPVKQCEHCRTARKSKSHHGKCDCGSKKDKKDKEKSEAKVDSGCCCHKGESCTCSTRSDTVEVRLERSLKRPTHPVKSKPALSKSQSEDKLLHVVNGHHKPCHRNNNLAHTSGAPYKVPRPHSLHGTSSISKSDDDDILTMFSSADDLLLRQTTRFSSPTTLSRTNSGDSLDHDHSATTEEIFSYDFDKHFAPRAQFTKPLDNVPEEGINYSSSWPQEYASEQSMNNLLGLTLDTSPNFTKDTGFQLFSPSDLPLISPQMSNFNQTISHSSDSANDSLWAGDSVFVHGRSAVDDTWTSPESTAALDNFLHSAKFDVSSHSMSTSQSRHLSSSSAVTAINLSSGASSENGGNALVIPADPDSPSEEAVHDWWPESFVKVPTQPTAAANYSWLYQDL